MDKISTYFTKRNIYKYTILAIDFLSFFFLLPLAYIINVGANFSHFFNTPFLIWSLLFTIIKVVLHFVTGNYDVLWMYRTKHSYLRMLAIMVAGNLIVFVILLIANACNERSVDSKTFVTFFLLEFFYIIVSRFIVNIYLENFYVRKKIPSVMKRTLIVGAGSAGNMILTEFGLNKEYGYNIVGFIDDSPDKINTKMNNVKVYGPISTINGLIDKLKIEEVIIAIPSAGKTRIREIVNIIDYKNVNVHIVPDTTRLLDNGLTETLRKVSITDLLGRESVQLDTTGLQAFLGGKIILVTGAGGSIGSEICRQVLHYGPKELIAFDIYENGVYDLIMELQMFYKSQNIPMPCVKVLIGSVRDEKRIDEIFKNYQPQIVFHAAAHKHVPLMEDSPKEAIKNNVLGTYNIVKYCDMYKIEKMVMISTDKAVKPTNVMGATKRFAEMVVEAWQKQSKFTKFSMVRFGNVLGSNGSVIPLFEKQIENGGPVTVTSDKINRFFMTIPEACSLVIQSGAFARGGEKFILDMGEPVKIIDLATKMIQLMGMEVDKDIKIEITGLRPGEKLHEELLLDVSKATKTENNKIFVEKSLKAFTVEQIDEIIKDLLSLSFDSNTEVLDFLKKIEEKKSKICTKDGGND